MLCAADAAPSLYDSRPWRFHATPARIELYPDHTRVVPGADPDHREPQLARGAALCNLRVAIKALGIYPDVHIYPDPARPDLVAIVHPAGRHTATPADHELAAAIPRCRTNQPPLLPVPVPASLRTRLRRAVEAEQTWLATVPATRLAGLHALRHRTDLASDSLVVVIGSFQDNPPARLQAGQAAQRVLLTAIAAGFSASLLSQVTQLPATRRQLRELIGGGLWPQTVLRIG